MHSDGCQENCSLGHVTMGKGRQTYKSVAVMFSAVTAVHLVTMAKSWVSAMLGQRVAEKCAGANERIIVASRKCKHSFNVM